MAQLSSVLASRYRPATDREICLWSFGLLTTVRQPKATRWEEQIGTLDDQRIFGPRNNLECACGTYRGEGQRNMICDRCGVKVASLEVRRHRFAHIDLALVIPHPLGGGNAQLSKIPVLPAGFIESSGGEALAGLYEGLLRAATIQSDEQLRTGIDRLVDLLLPVLSLAHTWDLQETATLARGLALELRTDDERCPHCGYPLEGLASPTCPACGKQRKST
jgi:hypothetical protein